MRKRKAPPQCPECEGPLPLAPGDKFEVNLPDDLYLSVSVMALERRIEQAFRLPGRLGPRADVEKSYVLRELPGAIDALVSQLIEEAEIWARAESGQPTQEDVEFAIDVSGFAIRERMGVWPRERGGSEPVLNLSDEECLRFFNRAKLLRPRWRALVSLFDSDPQGKDWRDEAGLLDAPAWLLKDLTSGNKKSGNPVAWPIFTVQFCAISR